MMRYDKGSEATFNLFRVPKDIHWGNKLESNKLLFLKGSDYPIVTWLFGTIISAYFATDARSYSIAVHPFMPVPDVHYDILEFFKKLTHKTGMLDL